MDLTVYGYEGNPRTRIIRIVAAFEEIPLHISKVIPRQFINTDEYKAKFPLSRGKVPALEGPGIKIHEVIAITTYLASIKGKAQLLGDGSKEQYAEIISWLSWSNQEMLSTMAAWFLPLIGGLAKPAPFNEQAVIAGKGNTFELLSKLDDYLGSRAYVVGDKLSLADIFITIYLSRGFEWVLDAEWRNSHPNTMKYFEGIASREQVKAVIPEFKFIEKETPIKDPYGSS